MADADPSLRPRLQAALGAGIILDRELAPEGDVRVFLASDSRQARLLVVKVIPAVLEPAVAATFARELRRAGALEHANILPVRSAGHAAGTPYWVTPLLVGDSLRQRLDAGTRLDPREAARLLADVARALAHAHERGIAHLELSADRVLLSPGLAVVSDFGVGRALVAIGGAGTAGAAADASADVHAWGEIAREVLASAWESPEGRLPVPTPAGDAVPPDPRPPPPAGLAELVAECRSPDPGARPATARDVLERLERITAPPPAPVEVLADRFRSLPRATGREHRARGVAITLVLAGAIVAAVVLLLRALG